MDQGQQRFYSFILDRVPDDNESAAKTLLEESFKKQADGTFDKAYVEEFKFKLLPLLKPEAVEEVTAIITGFGAGLSK
jgi:hypothetical protein